MYFRIATIGLVAALVTGCAGEVKREGNLAAPAKLSVQKYKQVTVSLNDQAQTELSDNVQFDPDRLRDTITRVMKAKGMIADNAADKLDIKITDIRVRSNFSAIMFGFMAGSDHVTGTVKPLDASDKPLETFEVSASYALGGLGGGQNDARMGWLYDKFAELTVKELTGQTQKQ